MVHNLIGRADWTQSSNDTWGVRWVGQWLDQLHDATLPATGDYPGNGANRTALNQNLNVTYTHVFSSTLLNEAHAGFNRFNLQERAQDRNFDATTLGLGSPEMMTFLLSGIDSQSSGNVPNYDAFGNGAIGGWVDGNFIATQQFPTLDGVFPYARLGAPLYAPSDHQDWSWFLSDNISWTLGRHQVKLGGEYRRFLNNVMDGGLNRGLVYSGNIGEFTHDSQTCNSSCGDAFFAPTFDYAQKNYTPYDVDLKSHAISLFAEDTWHVHPRLTVTFGVRWESYSRPKDENNQLWNFDPAANGLVQQGTRNVVDQFNSPCDTAGGTTVPYNITPAFFGYTNGWDCQPTGEPGLTHGQWTASVEGCTTTASPAAIPAS